MFADAPAPLVTTTVQHGFLAAEEATAHRRPLH
jgi:hypothetical protein